MPSKQGLKRKGGEEREREREREIEIEKEIEREKRNWERGNDTNSEINDWEQYRWKERQRERDSGR